MHIYKYIQMYIHTATHQPHISIHTRSVRQKYIDTESSGVAADAPTSDTYVRYPCHICMYDIRVIHEY